MSALSDSWPLTPDEHRRTGVIVRELRSDHVQPLSEDECDLLRRSLPAHLDHIADVLAVLSRDGHAPPDLSDGFERVRQELMRRL